MAEALTEYHGHTLSQVGTLTSGSITYYILKYADKDTYVAQNQIGTVINGFAIPNGDSYILVDGYDINNGQIVWVEHNENGAIETIASRNASKDLTQLPLIFGQRI